MSADTNDADEQQDPLDWIRAHRGRVADLADSDRRIAVDARAVLDYLDDEGTDGFEDILTSPRRSYLSLPDARRRARNVRDALTDGETGDQ